MSRGLRRLAVVAIAGAFVMMLGSTFACGTEPVGVDACRKIEKVRCESARGCGISLDRPAHVGTSPEEDVAACVRYYDDECLHGVVTNIEPAPQAVDACVKAIIAGTCEVVKQPEKDPACTFLIPPAKAAAAADAAAEAAPLVDAASDG